jgi:hypothetical protein
VKVIKTILILLAIFVVIGGTAIFLFIRSLDSVVAKAIEHGGSSLAGTGVVVESVDISLREGRGTVKGLTVQNPEGFSDAQVLTLGEVTLDLDLKSLRSERVLVEEVRIGTPRVTYEVIASGRSNIDTIRQQIETQSSGAASSGSEGPDRRMTIQRLNFEEGEIRVDASALGIDPQDVRLPSFELTNLGGDEGALPDEIGREIGVAFTQAVLDAVARSRVETLIEEKVGGETGEAATRLLRSLGR